MRHRVVKRIVWGLAATSLAASALFAWLVTPPAADPGPPSGNGDAPPSPSGEPLFRAHCATCHTPAELEDGLRDAGSLDADRAELLELLSDHGASTDVEDAAIADWLLDRAWPP